MRRTLPLAFGTFLIGGAALVGLPLVTAGFFSKDKILWLAWASERGGPGLYAAGLAGVLLTALYVARLIGLVFLGPPNAQAKPAVSLTLRMPLYALSFFAITAGYLDVVHGGGLQTLTTFLQQTLPGPELRSGVGNELTASVLTALVAGVGLVAAVPWVRQERAVVRSRWRQSVAQFWQNGWNFDVVYQRVFVAPILWFARVGKWDVVDAIYDAMAEVARDLHRLLSATETGRVRTYAAGLALGALVFLALVLAS